MKDQLLQRMEGVARERRLNLAREYLQLFLLRQIHETGALLELALVGGTALRLLHGLPRFSEDLDFAAHPARGRKRGRLEPASLFRELKDRLLAAGYEVSVKARLERTVANAFFRFAGLPAEIGLATDRRGSLSVKVEIDTKPPEGARVETTLVQHFFPIALRHYDLASLFAGKLHALLTRPYAKGRDWYDLVWYLTAQRTLAPNEMLLRRALEQTGHPSLPAGSWPKAVRRKLKELDWDKVTVDLKPFLEMPSDLEQLTLKAIDKLLAAKSG